MCVRTWLIDIVSCRFVSCLTTNYARDLEKLRQLTTKVRIIPKKQDLHRRYVDTGAGRTAEILRVLATHRLDLGNSYVVKVVSGANLKLFPYVLFP